MTMTDQPDTLTPRDGSPPMLVVDGLSVTYGQGDKALPVLDSVDLEVGDGEFTCIVGPSGTGKTTLLRCLAGLQQPTAGVVRVEGAAIDGPPASLAPVFQDYSRSLMPWLTVMGNITLPLRAHVGRSERRRRAERALHSVGLEGTADKYPWQLSGGMQQRVAIARALAYQPRGLLMDEPFASVDAQTRADLEDLILSVRAEYGITVVLVTHDIDEAVYLADQVVVLAGRPAQVVETILVPFGSPRDQIHTKARPDFLEYRSHLLELLTNRR